MSGTRSAPVVDVHSHAIPAGVVAAVEDDPDLFAARVVG